MLTIIFAQEFNTPPEKLYNFISFLCFAEIISFSCLVGHLKPVSNTSVLNLLFLASLGQDYQMQFTDPRHASLVPTTGVFKQEAGTDN